MIVRCCELQSQIGPNCSQPVVSPAGNFPPPLPLIRTRFSETLLAAPDFQAVQFSIVTFHRFVTTGMIVAVFVTQIPIIIGATPRVGLLMTVAM